MASSSGWARQIERLSPQQIEELKRLNWMSSFDEQAIPNLKSEAIDFRAASELFAPYRQVASQAWNTLRILTEYQGRQVPTIGGLLLFGKDRFARFPDAWIQAGRFAGTNRTRLLDSTEIRSLLPLAAEEAIAFAGKHLTRESIIEGARREDRWSIPLVAIREALMNAIVHADYAQQGAPIRLALFDDRIEIENPGLLPFGLTIEDIMQGVSKLRNRVIARVFHELHLIEQWGERNSAHDRGLPGGWPGRPEAGRNRHAFSRDHSQRAGQEAPYGRDGPAHPRVVQRRSCTFNGSRGQTRRAFPNEPR